MVSLLVYHLELIKFRWSTQWLNIKSNHISSCKFSIYFAKKYFFYFIYPLLQNTHISLSILHIYSIKYSFFFTFFIISFPLEQTHKLVFSVEPHPHPHPSFNKITHTQLATVFSVELQTQHKPKITHTQPPATINDIKQKWHWLTKGHRSNNPIIKPSQRFASFTITHFTNFDPFKDLAIDSPIFHNNNHNNNDTSFSVRDDEFAS